MRQVLRSTVLLLLGGVLLPEAASPGRTEPGAEPVGFDGLAREVDMRPEIERRGIPYRRQGRRPTCSIHAVTFLLEYATSGLFGPEFADLSDDYLNHAANLAVGKTDDGDFFHAATQGHAVYGIVRERDMPGRPRYDFEADAVAGDARRRGARPPGSGRPPAALDPSARRQEGPVRSTAAPGPRVPRARDPGGDRPQPLPGPGRLHPRRRARGRGADPGVGSQRVGQPEVPLRRPGGGRGRAPDEERPDARARRGRRRRGRARLHWIAEPAPADRVRGLRVLRAAGRGAPHQQFCLERTE